MPDPYVHVPVTSFDALAAGGSVPLPADEDHHLRRVLRLGRGAQVVVSDGAGRDAPARLGLADVTLTDAPADHPSPAPAIHLLQGLSKGRKVDEVIRAATEFGVAGVTIVVGARSVVELRGDKRDRVRARWEAVARSAAGQSRRPHLPAIGGPLTVADAAALPRGWSGVLPHVGAPTGLRAGVSTVDGDAVAVAIGPEGGWTDGEVARFEEAGFVPVTLGPSVLRTEHAGLAAIAATAALLGWMD